MAIALLFISKKQISKIFTNVSIVQVWRVVVLLFSPFYVVQSCNPEKKSVNMDLPTTSSSHHSFSVSPFLTPFLSLTVLLCLVGFPGILAFSQQWVMIVVMKEGEKLKSDWLTLSDQSSPALVVEHQSQVLGRLYIEYLDCSCRNEEEILSDYEKDAQDK